MYAGYLAAKVLAAWLWCAPRVHKFKSVQQRETKHKAQSTKQCNNNNKTYTQNTDADLGVQNQSTHKYRIDRFITAHPPEFRRANSGTKEKYQQQQQPHTREN